MPMSRSGRKRNEKNYVGSTMQLLCKVRQANKVENVINGNFHSGGGAYLFPFIMKIDPIRLELLGKVFKNCHY